MNERWGRSDAAGTWPHPKPMWTLAVLLSSLVTIAAVGGYQYVTAWTPLQRAYLPTYARTWLMEGLGISHTGRYRLLHIVDRTGSRMALDDEVSSVQTATGQTTFAIGHAAVRPADRELAWQDSSYNHARLHAFLERWIYRDQSLADLFRTALWSGVGVFVIGLFIAVPNDVARARDRRQGRRLKGRELVTVARFNRRTRADGIGFIQLTRAYQPAAWLRIPRALESSHI
jgi:hypothetical protein